MKNTELSTRAYQLVQGLDDTGQPNAAQVVRDLRAEIEHLEDYGPHAPKPTIRGDLTLKITVPTIIGCVDGAELVFGLSSVAEHDPELADWLGRHGATVDEVTAWKER